MSTHPLSFRLILQPSALAGLPRRLLTLSAVSRSRRSLRLLDDHLLRDIGVTREEALSEAVRAPWDAPAHWKG